MMNKPDTCSALARHTELPWSVLKFDECRYAICFGDSEFHIVAVTSQGNDEANAAYIVKCANAYPRLVEVIRNLVASINTTAKGECREKYGDEHGTGECGEYDWTHFISFACIDAIKDAEAALAEAGEQ